MSDETSITVNHDGVNSFAAALWNPQQYEIFIDDQKIGELNGYTNHKSIGLFNWWDMCETYLKQIEICVRN